MLLPKRLLATFLLTSVVGASLHEHGSDKECLANDGVCLPDEFTDEQSLLAVMKHSKHSAKDVTKSNHTALAQEAVGVQSSLKANSTKGVVKGRFCDFRDRIQATLLERFQKPCDVNEFRRLDFSAKILKALIVTTSHNKLGAENCTTCKPTGLTLTEAAAPFWIFKDAGIEVDVASIKGGQIPDDGIVLTHFDCRLLNDAGAWGQFQNSLAVDSLDFKAYDVIWLAGGWGAAWDFGTSTALASRITRAAATKTYLASVSHGALGFILATKADGSLLVNGTRMTAVTDRQIDQLGFTNTTPMHPETELRKLGAVFEAQHKTVETMASYVVTDLLTSEGQIVTGQNQNSACGTALEVLERLRNDPRYK